MLSLKQREYRREAVKTWNIKIGATRSGKTYGDYFLLPKRLLDVRGKDPDAWGADRNRYFVVGSHPGLTDLFLSQVRKEKEQEKKPSVIEKLKPAPDAVKAPAAHKHTQER